MLSQAQKNQLKEAALADCERQVSNAALWYKRVEDRDGWEKAQEASDYYVSVQRAWLNEQRPEEMAEHALEQEAIEVAYAEYLFERGQEM